MRQQDSRYELELPELKRLVESARANDPEAWERLYLHSYVRLISYARRRLHDAQAAEEAVSDAMLRAMERIDSFEWEGAGYDAWMYGIVRNVVHEIRRGRTRTQRLNDRQSAVIDLRDDPTVRAFDRVENHDRAALLRRAFDTLSDADQEVLELRVVGGLTAEEVGLTLDKQAGAVRMAQSRALERLRMAMKELARD